MGNTTKRRPDPLPVGYTLPDKETRILLEQGGYSGPQLFERTVALVKRYRKILDESDLRNLPEQPRARTATSQPGTRTTEAEAASPIPSPSSSDNVIQEIEATIQHDLTGLKDATPEAEAEADSKPQPLLRLPEPNNPASSAVYRGLPEDPPALSLSSHIEQLPSPEQSLPHQREPEPAPSHALSTASPTSSSPPPFAPPHQPPESKVIFATGGITNGRQALEVLNAGASVAQVYTARVYGGVGTISRIKDEMREELSRNGNRKP